MPRSLLIIITGLPGTGKTHLGKLISSKYHIPFFSRDTFKELIFDVLGHDDRVWSQKVGAASYDIMYHVLEENLKSGQKLIAETYFHSKSVDKKFAEFQKKYDFDVLQINCITNSDILIDRFIQRANSSERHPGHADLDYFEETKKTLSKGGSEFIDIEGEKMVLDTTDLDNIDYSTLFQTIELMINK
jgi:predicted kinase